MSVEIAYTEQRENHGTMILRGVSYSTYTLRYEPYNTYGIAPSSQSSLTFFLVFVRRVPWVVLTPHCVSPNVMLIIQYALYIISLKTLHLPSGKGVLSH